MYACIHITLYTSMSIVCICIYNLSTGIDIDNQPHAEEQNKQ